MAGVAEKVRSLLASSATFQTRVGVATSTLAEAFIYIQGRSPQVNKFSRPFAVVEGLWQSKRTIRRGAYRSGTIRFYIEDDIPGLDTDSHEAASTDFVDFVETVVGEMMENQEDGTQAHLLVQEISIDQPRRVAQEEAADQGDYYGCWCTLVYGFGA